MSIPGPSNEKVQLNTSYIGEGDKLYHVSTQSQGWPHATLWLVASDTLEEAITTAVAEQVAYNNGVYTAEDFKTDGTDGYLIGVIL